MLLLLLFPDYRFVLFTNFVDCKEDCQVESKIEVLTTVKIQHSPDLYKIVDALNRSLKHNDLMFGLALDQLDNSKAIFTIYRT